MKIEKLNREDFTKYTLGMSMLDLDMNDNLTSKYLKHFTEKKLGIDYVNGQDFHDSSVYNLYGRRISFSEYIDFIEQNPQEIKSRFLKRRILAQLSRIDNRVSYSLSMLGVKKEAWNREIEGKIGLFVKQHRKPIAYSGKVFARKDIPKDFNGLHALYTELKTVVSASEEIFNNLKGE